MKIIYILAIVSFLSGCDGNSFLEKHGLKEKITNVIQVRNEIAYLPNSDEPFTGRYEEFYSNGQKKMEVNIVDGRANGLKTFWYESGQKQFEESYKDGLVDKLSMSWYENGQKESETNYKDHKLNGLVTKWHHNGQKSYEGSYKDGKRDGLYTLWWHENGEKRFEGAFKDDKNITPSVLETIDDLKKYANGFVVTAKINMFNPKVVEVKDVDSKINIFNPEVVEVEDVDHYIDSYTITFQTSDPELINKYISYNASIKNTAIEIAFREKFCTSELKSILSKHDINKVSIDFIYDKQRVNKKDLTCYIF